MGAGDGRRWHTSHCAFRSLLSRQMAMRSSAFHAPLPQRSEHAFRTEWGTKDNMAGDFGRPMDRAYQCQDRPAFDNRPPRDARGDRASNAGYGAQVPIPRRGSTGDDYRQQQPRGSFRDALAAYESDNRDVEVGNKNAPSWSDLAEVGMHLGLDVKRRAGASRRQNSLDRRSSVGSDAQPQSVPNPPASSSPKSEAGIFQMLGKTALRNSDFADAIVNFSQALKLTPNSHSLYAERSAAHLALGHNEKALQDAEKAVALKPEWDKAYVRKAAALQALGRLEDAVSVYEQGLTISPDNLACLDGINEAEQALKAKQPQHDSSPFDQRLAETTAAALERETNAWKQTGDASLKSRDLERALACYGKAIEIDPNDYEAYSKRSAAHLACDKPAEALEDASVCIRLKPEWVKAYLRKAAALRMLGQNDQALMAYREGLRVAPSDAACRNGIEAIMRSRGGQAPTSPGRPGEAKRGSAFLSKQQGSANDKPKLAHRHSEAPGRSSSPDILLKHASIGAPNHFNRPHLPQGFDGGDNSIGSRSDVAAHPLREVTAARDAFGRHRSDFGRPTASKPQPFANQNDGADRKSAFVQNFAQDQPRTSDNNAWFREPPAQERPPADDNNAWYRDPPTQEKHAKERETLSALEWKARGNKALEEDDPQEALRCYTAAIEMDSSDATFFSNRSAAYYSLGNGHRALEDANETMRLRPDWVKAYVRKGSALKLLNRLEEAISAFEDGLRVAPNDPLCQDALTEAREELKPTSSEGGSRSRDWNNYDALRITDQSAGSNARDWVNSRDNNNDSFEKFRGGQSLNDSGGGSNDSFSEWKNKFAAPSLGDRSMGSFSDSGERLNARGAISIDNNQFNRPPRVADARMDKNAQFRATPGFGSGYSPGSAEEVTRLKDLGNAALSRGDGDGAVRYYSHAIQLDNRNHTLFSNRSAAYLSINDPSRALHDADKCIDLCPSWVKGYLRRGAALMAMKRYEDAEKAYAGGLRVQADNVACQDGVAATRQALKGGKQSGWGWFNKS